jgi:hypothetical protein
MENSNDNEAYQRGFKSALYDNPYSFGSHEYNECERGWSQRLRRGFYCISEPKKKETKNISGDICKKIILFCFRPRITWLF